MCVGIIAAAGKGVFRTMLCEPDKTADLVPVDMVINLMIVAGWKMGTQKTREIPIYNCCTGKCLELENSKLSQMPWSNQEF